LDLRIVVTLPDASPHGQPPWWSTKFSTGSPLWCTWHHFRLQPLWKTCIRGSTAAFAWVLVQDCVKTATDMPANGKTVEKTTVTRVIPTDFNSEDRKLPDFWSYIESLTAADWERHLLYLYRRVSDTGPMVPLEKSSGFITMSNNVQVAVGNKEEFEFAIQQKYGGGTYRLLLKKGAERVGDHRISIDGPPKAVQPGILVDNAPNVNPVAHSSNDVATTAMNLVANKEAEAVNVAINALRGASEVVQRFSSGNGGGDDVTREFMRVMIARAMNPPDPMDSIAKMLGIFQTLMGALNPGAAQNPVIQRIMDSALDRLMNPVSSGGSTSTTTALVQTLPAIASHVKEALTEWRVGMEVQRDVIMRSQPQQLPAGSPPGAPSPTVLQPPAPAAAKAPEGQQAMTVGPPLEFIETKIVEILGETLGEPNGADIAGEEVFMFLDRMDPRITAHLIGLGEAGLFELFQTRPILKRATTNPPRLQEFIRAFLKYSKPEPSAPNGTATVKPN